MEQEPQDQHGVEAQQAAAKDYQPVLEGPFVGDKVSSDAITEEYAKADPVYVEKTLALSQAYSHYRRIQGDGNCGWRAIGFSYFEKLIDHGDQGQIEGEVARLTSLNNMLATVGGYSYYDDFFEPFAELLRDVAASMPNHGAAHMIALQRWNDESIASSLIYYLRLLAATYLKANAANYDPFVPDDVGVLGYCSGSIELPNREIEHLGINGLANVLLKPVNFVLDIAYLDRSAGDAVNSYRFPEDTNEQDPSTVAAIIHLLYRPDHYDIIYPAPPAPVPIPVRQQAPMQVHRVNGFSHNLGILQTSMGGFSTVDFSAMGNIPIPSFSPAVLTPLAPPLPSPMSDTYAGSLQHHHHHQQPQHQQQPLPNPWMAPFTEDMETSPGPSNQPAMVSPPLSVSPLSRGGSIDSGMVGGGLGQQHAAAGPPTPGYQIRFSPVQLEYDEGKRDFPEQAFHLSTSTFKNSVYNRAHFGNPDFHPEEWCPDDESIDSRVGGKRKIKKET
ncbi:peptidase C65 Otubain-domain-containing protein [Stachybotrys elegans]|uniref:ubiquitinyl hydrolase 1 n=1 Tax=Stachybotrys elegans TaxID=80388 RepID=A0A8K0WPU8_9HYPO|nr:peptidase C65 Otubain-domain-containing protein [Stachybotrys elegans]